MPGGADAAGRAVRQGPGDGLAAVPGDAALSEGRRCARGRSRLSPEEGTLPLVQTRRGPPGVRRALGGHLWTGLRLRSLLLRTEVGGASHGDVTKPPQQAAAPHLGLGLEKRFPWLSDRVMRRGAAPRLFGTDRGAGRGGPRGLAAGPHSGPLLSAGVRHAGSAEARHGDDDGGRRGLLHARVPAPGTRARGAPGPARGPRACPCTAGRGGALSSLGGPGGAEESRCPWAYGKSHLWSPVASVSRNTFHTRPSVPR